MLIATRKLNFNDTKHTIELHQTGAHRFEWYQAADGADMEMSAESIEEAFDALYRAYPDTDCHSGN